MVDHLEQIWGLPNLKNILLINIDERLVFLSLKVMLDSFFVLWLVLPNPINRVVLSNYFLRLLQTVPEIHMHHVRVISNQAVEHQECGDRPRVILNKFSVVKVQDLKLCVSCIQR
jgi:hypothetical protein